MGLAVLPVRLSLCRKQKKNRKPEIGVNVSQGRSNRCANFQPKRSKIVRIAA